MLHKHSFVVMWCKHWKLTILHTSGQKKLHLDLPSLLLFCGDAVCLQGKKKGKRVKYDSLFKWKKLHILQDMHELAS